MNRNSSSRCCYSLVLSLLLIVGGNHIQSLLTQILHNLSTQCSAIKCLVSTRQNSIWKWIYVSSLAKSNLSCVYYSFQNQIIFSIMPQKFQYLIVMMKLFSASVANDENDQWNLSPFKYSIFRCDSISKFHSVPLSLPPSVIICIKCFLCQSYYRIKA